MHVITETRQTDSKDQPASLLFSLPRVSIIIVNYNYGRYLKQAVDSVFAQTYPNIECIIVDNASTDESPAILEAISKQYPSATILRRATSGGQNVAAFEGFNASSGEYIILMDADDVLLASCVETHIFAHLSLRIAVGFTSADMIQSVESRMVLGTIHGLSEFVRSGRGRYANLMRRIDEAAPELWPLRRADAGFADEVHFAKPSDIDFTFWCWAPTSGNCFRREALQLFMNNEKLQEFGLGTDAYLLRGIGVLMGSVVIDRPLAVYRLHGMNVFSKHPHLYSILAYERGGTSDYDLDGRKMVIDHLIAKSAVFLRKLEDPRNYMRALCVLDAAWPRIPSNVAGCKSYVAGKAVADCVRLRREFGPFHYGMLLKRLKVAPHVILRSLLTRKGAGDAS